MSRARSSDAAFPTSPRVGALPDATATVLLLAALAAIGQFASNVYTPSLPAVATDFDTSTANAQLTYVVFLAAFAVGQLVYGPVSDRIGRRPALFAGLALMLAGTLACAFASSIEALIIARAVQAIGAAAGLVVSRAATRDSFEGPALARTLAAVTIAFALVPGLTPLLGGIVQSVAGWRATFGVTLAAAVALTAWAALRLPETLGAGRTAAGAGAGTGVLADARSILGDRVFVATAASVGFVYGALSAFFAAAPALFMNRLGVGPAEYGLYPPLAVSGFVIGGIVVRRLSGGRSPRAIAATGLAIMALALVPMLGLPLAGVVHKHAFNGSMVGFVTGLGVFLPSAIAIALGRVGARAGTGASLQGFVQMSLGALGALVAGALQGSLPVLALPATMVGCTALAGVAFALAREPRQ